MACVVDVSLLVTAHRESDLTIIEESIALRATRVTACSGLRVAKGAQGLSWNYDVASGSYSSWGNLERKLRRFLEVNAGGIHNITSKFEAEISFFVTGHDNGNVGGVSLSPETLKRIADCGIGMSICFEYESGN